MSSKLGSGGTRPWNGSSYSSTSPDGRRIRNHQKSREVGEGRREGGREGGEGGRGGGGRERKGDLSRELEGIVLRYIYECASERGRKRGECEAERGRRNGGARGVYETEIGRRNGGAGGVYKTERGRRNGGVGAGGECKTERVRRKGGGMEGWGREESTRLREGGGREGRGGEGRGRGGGGECETERLYVLVTVNLKLSNIPSLPVHLRNSSHSTSPRAYISARLKLSKKLMSIVSTSISGAM